MKTTSNIHLLKWFNFLLDFRPYGPIAIVYFSQVTGSYALGLAVFSVAAIATAGFEIPTGVLSDFLGRKKTMLLGAIASTAAIALYALGYNFGFGVLIAGAILEGLARSLFSGNNEALLYDTLADENKKDEFPEYLGKVSSMFQVGLAISALIGGFVAHISFALVMWVSVIPQAFGIVVSLLMKDPKKHNKEIETNIFSHLKESLMQFRQNSKLRTLSIGKIVEYGIGETMHQFSPAFFALLLPTWALGVVRTLNHAFAAMSFWFAGSIIARFTALKTLFASSSLVSGLTIFATAYPTIFSPFILAGGSLVFGASLTSHNTLLHKEFTDKQRATMGSITSFFGSIFFAVFAFLFGTLADGIGPAKAILIGAILQLPLIWLYWRLFKNNHDERI